MKTTAMSCIFTCATALGASVASAQLFHEDFDSYKTGSNIAGQGGWETWCTGGEDGLVSDAHSRSPHNSLRDTPASDIVQRFDETTGKFVFSFWVFIPVDASGGTGSINLMNTYCDGQFQTMHWSVSTLFDPTTGTVHTYGGDSLPLVVGAWAEYRAEFDLDADTLNEFYDGQPLTVDHSWSTNVDGGVPEFRASDFYNDTLTEVFFDDITLERVVACYADCDQSGALDLFDFLCFTNDFNAAGSYSDCDGNGTHDLFDFLCFVNAFNAGC